MSLLVVAGLYWSTYENGAINRSFVYGSNWLMGPVQKLLAIWCSHNNYIVCHKDRKKCAYPFIIKRFSLT